MKLVENNKHISMLGLAKFIASIAIVYLHCGHSNTKFHTLYLLVEFFFFVTGYFTFKHFQKDEKAIINDSLDIKAKKAISYTVKKVKSFLPYVLLIALFRAGFSLYNGAEIISIIRNFTIESSLLVSQSVTDTWAIWFLSAMVIVFPLFILICQQKNRYLLGILFGTAAAVYFPSFYSMPGNGYSMVGSLIRAFIAMGCGVVVYLIADWLRQQQISKAKVWLLQIAELVLFIGSYVLMYPDPSNAALADYRMIVVLVFIAFLSILLSGKTFTARISSQFLDFLEKISLVIFIIHIPIIDVIMQFTGLKLTDSKLAIMTIITTIVSSIAIFCTVEYVKVVRKRNQPAIK